MSHFTFSTRVVYFCRLAHSTKVECIVIRILIRLGIAILIAQIVTISTGKVIVVVQAQVAAYLFTITELQLLF